MNLSMKHRQTHRHRVLWLPGGGQVAGEAWIGSWGSADANYRVQNR